MNGSNIFNLGAINPRLTITLLIWSFLVVSCVSLVLVSVEVRPAFHISFNARAVLSAIFWVGAIGLCVPLFALAYPALGFATMFYLLAVVAGYLWLSCFTPLPYDHELAQSSALVSWTAFALPAMIIRKSPLTRNFLTRPQMSLLAGSLIIAAIIVGAVGYLFGFQIVGFREGELARETLNPPTWMRYALTISTTTALPFAFAWFFLQKRYIVAVISLAVLLACYPIALNKTVLLTPFWLVFLAVLLKITSWRIAVILSLFLPLMLGVATRAIDSNLDIFSLINFRMLAIPASAMDHYNHYFSTHSLTHFCQITVIGKIFACSLADQLGVLMAQEYATGNYNASLMSTEGTASVGAYFAPLSALLCGMVIAVGNIASDRLDPAFVILSGAILLQTMMNVPMSTIMLTHGGFLMFALWFLTPRPDGPIAGRIGQTTR